METDKRKRSKIPCLFGGNGDNLNRKAVQPRPPSDGFTEQKLFAYEVGQASSKQVNGTPMKTLLAKEMLNETSAKKRSPSLIAKLMGLDGLPSPQPIHRQQRRLLDNSPKSTPKRIEKPFSQLDMKIAKEQHFKDVYEDPEASHVGNQLYSPPLTARRRSTKLEFGYIHERCDEMLRESTAIKTKLERVDSNSDLMLSFLHTDQQDVPFVSLCNQITVLRPSSAFRHGSHCKGVKEEKEARNCRVPVSHQRNENGHSGYSCHSNSNPRRSSRYHLDRRDATAISPTRIVVLKPNVAKIYNDKTFLHSPDESELIMDKGPPGEVRSSRHKSKEAREIARRITSQMKEGFESGEFDLFDSGFREYASASASESETMAVPSRNSFKRSDRPKRSPSNMSESAVIKEAKKRMSQRWKTHGYRDIGMVGKGSTLEEMLSVPNSETRDGTTECVVGPVGVNEEYGWRDGYLRRTSRSRSLPPHNRSHRRSNYHEAHADEKMIVHNEPLHRGQSKGMKEKFSHTEDLQSKNLKYSKRCQSFQHCSACRPDFDDILPTETYFEKEDPAEQVPSIFNIHDVTTNAASVFDVFRVSSELPNDLNLRILGDIDSSAVDEDCSNSQESSTANSLGTASTHLSGPEPESSEGSKEFDQHGQTSVLEVASPEDVSSGSDCFEKVSSQLNELRKQLHLLKMESGSTYDNPNDQDIDRSSSFAASESENWESTYLTALLQNSGVYDHDPYTFMTTLDSVDSPIDPCLFDHLEKKYAQDPTVSRSERRLFHDRVNEAMFVLFKTMISCSWVNPSQRGIQMTLTDMGFEDQLQKLLVKQEKEANEEIEDISIDKDLDWFQAVNEIDVVGKQIAEVLVNELVLEIVNGQ